MAEAPAPRRTSRFRELDGLRGLAALGVVVGHLTVAYDTRFLGEPEPLFAFRHGGFGVQLFFMISGFVILMSAQRAKRPSDFVISRVSRLYPVYWIALTLSTIMGVLWLPAHFATDLKTYLVNLTMIQRWLFVDNVDAVYWTLAIEMQFYAAIFVVLLLTRCRITPRLMLRLALVWTAVAIVVAIVAGPHSRGLDPQLVATPWKILLNLTLAEFGPLFSAGCMMLLARRGEVARGWPVAFGVVAIVVAAILHTPMYAFAVAGVVVIFLVVGFRESTPPLLWGPVQWLGKVSYSLYVFHTILSEGVTHALTPYVGRNGAMVAGLVAVLITAGILQRVGETWASARFKALLERVRARRDARKVSPAAA